MAWIRLIIALLGVNALLLAPRFAAIDSTPEWRIALEALLLVGLFAVLPRRRWSAALAWLTALLLVFVALVGLGNTLAWSSLSRPLNLYLDFHLLSAVFDLLTGTLGTAAAIGAVCGTALATAGLVWLVAVLLRSVRGGPTRAAGVVLVLAGALGSAVSSPAWLDHRLATPAVRLAVDQTRRFVSALHERERFAAELAADPVAGIDRPRLLAGLRDTDVLLGFIESYGVSAVFDPRYAPLIRPRLADLATRVDRAGLYMATGRLTSPVQGGQSWLAHGTLISGLWLDNQLRYDLMLASDHATLVDDFARAGHRTVALMPAITGSWPQGGMLGYDAVYARKDIDYAGPALNWVTMPDQFTWSFLQHAIRIDNPEPLFVELALISSHAPWTPILPVLDAWDSIRDGAVFDRWAGAGDPPAVLWRDYDRVREHYARSVDYALNVVAGYAERYVDAGTLLIVLGDHQPAPLVTGEDAPREVPVHVISGDPALIRPFLRWGFVPGAVPRQDGESPPRMDAFREWFVHAFSAMPDAPLLAMPRETSS